MSGSRYETINAELFALTYGSMVAQVVRDFEDPKHINEQLKKMGENIGKRIVDDFCSKTRGVKCRTFKESVETLARDGFRQYLGVSAVVDGWNADLSTCTLRLPDNPLADFVELPAAYSTDLRYSNILCGVVKGALESLSLKIECYFTKDVLNGDDATEMYVHCAGVVASTVDKDYEN